MTRKSARSLPFGPLLAIIGGGLGIASLLLPWFVFNTEGLQSAIVHVGTSQFAKDQATQGNSVAAIPTTMQATLMKVSPEYVAHLKGYQALSHWSFLIEAAAAGLAVLVGLLGMFDLLRKRGLILFACAIGLFARPFYALIFPPAGDILEPVGFTNAHLLNPTHGFWLSIVAGTVVLASTFGLTARAAIAIDAPTGKYADADGPFVPTLDTSKASSSSNYSPAPQGAYGSQGFVPGLGGAMHSSSGPNFGSTPAVYGADPVRPAYQAPGTAAPGSQPGAGGARRSTPPPKL